MRTFEHDIQKCSCNSDWNEDRHFGIVCVEEHIDLFTENLVVLSAEICPICCSYYWRFITK
jgi:hypothetical protein